MFAEIPKSLIFADCATELTETARNGGRMNLMSKVGETTTLIFMIPILDTVKVKVKVKVHINPINFFMNSFFFYHCIYKIS